MRSETQNTKQLEASFSTLILSIGSSAAIALGLSPDPGSGKTSVNKEVAKFNIELLKLLEEKTKNNLSAEEANLLKSICSDLQLKYVEIKS